jgi:hypothetical protein
LSAELAKHGATQAEDGFLIGRKDNGSYYIDASQEYPGDGEDVSLPKR